MFAQVSLGREGYITEAALSYGLLLVLVVAAHLTDVFLEVREPSKQAAALVTLERSQVVMTGPDVHGHCGVMTKRHATPSVVKKTTHWLAPLAHRRVQPRY